MRRRSSRKGLNLLIEEPTGIDSSPRCPALGHLDYREAERRVEAVFVAVGADLLPNLVLVEWAAVFDCVCLWAHGGDVSPEGEGAAATRRLRRQLIRDHAAQARPPARRNGRNRRSGHPPLRRGR
jgi:hypothetical protein